MNNKNNNGVGVGGGYTRPSPTAAPPSLHSPTTNDPLFLSSEDEEDDHVAGFVTGGGGRYAPVSGRQASPTPGSTRAASPHQPLVVPATAASGTGAQVSGKIGQQVPVGGPQQQQSAAAAVPVTNFDTLDEPVMVTIKRDLFNIWAKLRIVLMPHGAGDLWGPLLLCLTLAISLAFGAPAAQAGQVFTGVFFIVWAGAGIITVNSTLLGGKISFFQSVCVLGYCIFPLVIASILGLFFSNIIIRTCTVVPALVWSIIAATNFLSDGRLEHRRALAVYPLFLFYFLLAWLILISKSSV